MLRANNQSAFFAHGLPVDIDISGHGTTALRDWAVGNMWIGFRIDLDQLHFIIFSATSP